MKLIESIGIVIAVVEESEIHDRDVLDRPGMLHSLAVKVRVIGIHEGEDCGYHNGRGSELPQIAVEGETEEPQPERNGPSANRHLEPDNALDELRSALVVDLDQRIC